MVARDKNRKTLISYSIDAITFMVDLTFLAQVSDPGPSWPSCSFLYTILTSMQGIYTTFTRLMIVCIYIKIELSWDVLQIVPYLRLSATKDRTTFHISLCTIADKSRLSNECPIYSAI